MTTKELEVQLKDLHLSVSLYVVCVTELDPRSGAIVVNTAYGPYKDYDDAVKAMRKRYDEALRVRDLEDNNACDENDESIPGGYFDDEGAGIYVYADFAFGQLLEVVSYTIKETCIRPDMQNYINERAEKYKAAHPEIAGPDSYEYAQKIKTLSEEHKKLSEQHPEWSAEDHKRVANELWNKINGKDD